MTSIRFYFDFISPYAYVGWFSIRAIAERHGRALDPHPVLFAALLDAHGNKGPAEIPPKRRYTFVDAYRKAHDAGLGGITPPPSHPFNPLLALRVAGLDAAEDERRRVIDALFRAVWAGGGGVETPEAVRAILDGADVDGGDWVARAGAPTAKQALRARTDAALAAGVFGVPTAIADDELFWGVDGLGFLDRFLAGDDPLPGDLAVRWRDLPASATRPGSR